MESLHAGTAGTHTDEGQFTQMSPVKTRVSPDHKGLEDIIVSAYLTWTASVHIAWLCMDECPEVLPRPILYREA